MLRCSRYDSRFAWDGHDKANGGYIVVTSAGKARAYYIYNRDFFKEYLMNNTKYERASTCSHGYDSLYKKRKDIYQIEFVDSIQMKVGSLFSWIGGIDHGFEQAGIEIAWANDMDPAACKTYRYNFPNTYLIEGDVRDIDTRGSRFFEILRIIDIKRPRIVFFENVQILWNMTAERLSRHL